MYKFDEDGIRTFQAPRILVCRYLTPHKPDTIIHSTMSNVVLTIVRRGPPTPNTLIATVTISQNRLVSKLKSDIETTTGLVGTAIMASSQILWFYGSSLVNKTTLTNYGITTNHK